MVSKAPSKGLVDDRLEDKHKEYKMLSLYCNLNLDMLCHPQAGLSDRPIAQLLPPSRWSHQQMPQHFSDIEEEEK